MVTTLASVSQRRSRRGRENRMASTVLRHFSCKLFQEAVAVFCILSCFSSPSQIHAQARIATYRVCASEVAAKAMELGEGFEIGCDAATTLRVSSNCSSTTESPAMCIHSIDTKQVIMNSGSGPDCLGLCSSGPGDRFVAVTWSYRAQWCLDEDIEVDEIDESLVEEYFLNATDTCDGLVYKSCEENKDCGEGYCCSLPSAETVQAGDFCGPPSKIQCLPDASSPSGLFAVPVDRACRPIARGTCILSGESDIRPGYSCINNPCKDLQLWAESICGYNPNTKSFDLQKRCSKGCSGAIKHVGKCPNLASMIDAYSRLSLLDCSGCGDYFFQRCLDASDCPLGYCCSLPPLDKSVIGFFDENTCGPPEACQCLPVFQLFGGIAEQIQCSLECGPREYGTCQEIGIPSDTYNPLYKCDCADPTLVGRTPSPPA